jgi:hypothetical protein
MEHAFWNADFEACQRLLDAGKVLDQEAVLWMVRLVLEERQSTRESGTPAALRFIKGLPAESRCAALRHPMCLALALRQGRLEIAQEIWDLGPQLSHFSEKFQVGDLIYPAPAPPEEWAELGVLSLNGAAKWSAAAILEGLLQLGVRPIPPCALLHAVNNQNDEIIGILMKHSGVPHMRDTETDSNVGSEPEYHPIWQQEDGCINPIKLAIQRGRNSAIKVMLEQSQAPIEPWFRYFYLKEAYTLLKPATVACLLEHPSMRFDESDITNEADLPLAHLVRHADRICAVTHDRDNSEYGPRLRMDNVKSWMACVAAFARAGVDPAMRDRAGRSALDYLAEHLAYAGRDRFRIHLASELRSVGEVQREDPLDPAGCWEALKVLG